jgi:4-amino-4-deoxy-L-arabinose transferase-like glycosyltransferase
MPLSPIHQPADSRPRAHHILALLGLWLIIFFAALFSPPLLDDADATHSQAARAMVTTGDWVTLHVNGIRYLEKPPLPYWLVALGFRIFGFNTFSVHLPLALAVLALAVLGYCWARRAFDDRTAFYTALSILTCTGVFLFTRIFIPEVLLSLFLCLALYTFLRTLEATSQDPNPTPTPGAPSSSRTLRLGWTRPYCMWTTLALAVLTKGLVALVFFFATAALYLLLTGQTKKWRSLRPFSGLILFLFIAAPWHILASLRNTGGENGHGFFWFYFINEHVLRFLGRRIPRDYNKLPGYLYWSLHLVWLFPWSLFAPLAAILGWRGRSDLRALTQTASGRTILLLSLYSTFVLLFFSFSTNQEYYTFPIYLPLLLLIAAAFAIYESAERTTLTARRLFTLGHALFFVLGLAISATLLTGLYRSRNLPAPSDIGELLAHRDIGSYTLSTSHFFDLTTTSLAALRLPALIAALAFLIGPGFAWLLRQRRRHIASTATMTLTAGAFLIAAHIAFVRFAPLLSSQDFAARIQRLDPQEQSRVLIYGDQAFGSSIPFYLHRHVELVDGRTTSMQFGSTFPDAPLVFLTHQQLAATWGTGPRQFLFVPPDHREEAEHLLAGRTFLIAETSGKLLLTDRPLAATQGALLP